MIETLLILALALSAPPDLVGLGTYYGPPTFNDGDGMRNGEPLRLEAPTVAVDASHWEEMANVEAVVFIPG